MKRIIATGDWHCGHVVGLTPPKYQFQETGDHYRDKFAKIQRQMWEWWVRSVEKYQPIDRLIINGDAIEGKGPRSGSTELFTADRLLQGKVAVEVARSVEADEIAMTYGTTAHTGGDEDLENPIAQELGATIESHLNREVEGVRIDARHFIGSSSIPHGRYTALAREDLWRVLWADRSEGFTPHLLLRSHVHYHAFAGNEWVTMMTLPCMQGLGSKFGSRVCSGTVSLGFVVIDCEDGKFTWRAEIMPLANQVGGWKPW